MIGVALSEAVYASTRIPTGTAATVIEGDQKCEVKSDTVALLINAVKQWLTHREPQTWCAYRKWDSADESEMLDCQMSVDSVGLQAIQAVESLLKICDRPDCHWRAQVAATSTAMALRGSLGEYKGPAGKESYAKGVWASWASWLMRCCNPKVPPALHSLGVHGLMLLLKNPAPLRNDDLMQAGLLEPEFLEHVLEVVPHLHHTGLRQGEQGDRLDHVHGLVQMMTEPQTFKLWPCTWIHRSSSTFSLWNALFWQSLAELALDRNSERLEMMMALGASVLVEKPASEVEYHVAFNEFSAGLLRALRNDAAKEQRSQAWTTLHPFMASEFQQASQERLAEWCDAVRFIVAGTSRPLLSATNGAFSPPPPAWSASLTPLFNFATCSEETPKVDVLSCSLAPIRFDDDATTGAAGGEAASFTPLARGGSSFDAYKRLRILMAILLEPAAVAWIEAEQAFCDHLFDSLRSGLGHPYKQLREEAARSLFILLRAAGNRSSAGLGGVAKRIESWLCEEAVRLLAKLREDNSAQRGKDGQRPRHVIESSGLCYVFIHTSLARVTSHVISRASECFELLLAAAAHDDFELRILAGQALAHCCAQHPASIIVQVDRPWCNVASVQTIVKLLDGSSACALSEKEREKALVMAARPLLLANMFVLNTQVNSGEKEFSGRSAGELRVQIERALGDSHNDVRNAAKSTLASIMSLDSEQSILSHLKRFKAMVSKEGKPESDGMIAGIMGLSCVLLVAMDRGASPWMGQAIEAIAPYGRSRMPEVVRKEVQSTLQAFLKLQQSTQQSWQECRDLLTAKQFDMLNEYKGNQTYFS